MTRRISETERRALAHQAVFNGFALAIGLLITIIGLLAMLGDRLDLPWPLAYSPQPGRVGLLDPTQVGIFSLGLSLLLVNNWTNRKKSFWTVPLAFLCILALGATGLSIIGLYMDLSYPSPLAPLVENFSGIHPTFLSGVGFLILALALFSQQLGRHREWVVVYLVCVPALLVLGGGLFALVGYEYDILPFYSFRMSLPTIYSFIFAGLAILVGTLPNRGLLLPLLAPGKCARALTLATLATGLGVLYYTLVSVVIRSTLLGGANLPVFVAEFYVESELVVLVIVTLIITVGLRAVHYYTEATFYARQERRARRRESVLRQMIQTVHSSLDLDYIFQQVTGALGRYLRCDRCFLTMYDINTGCLTPPTVEYRSSPHISSILSTESQELAQALKNIFGKTRCQEQRAELMEIHSQTAHLPPETREFLARLEIRSALACPIINQDACLAILFIHYVKTNHPWTSGEKKLIASVAEQAGVAIYRASLLMQERQARQELEESRLLLEESNRELEQFATIAAHDLQSPLRKVRMLSEQLSKAERNDVAPDTLHLLDRIHASVCQMQALTDDVLSLARISSSHKEFQPVDLGVILRLVLNNLEPVIQEKQPRVEVGELMVIPGDSGQLKQLVQNLLDNALKFQTEGQTPVIRVYAEPAQENCCRLIVADNGVGFNMAQAERIFQPFERLHGVSSYPGTGIGLAICRRIVERHQGSISVHSEPGRGTTIAVSLPCLGPSEVKPLHIPEDKAAHVP